MIYALCDKTTGQILRVSPNHFAYNFIVMNNWEEKELDFENCDAFCSACPDCDIQPISASPTDGLKWLRASNSTWYKLKVMPDSYKKYKNTSSIDNAIEAIAANLEEVIA